MSKSCILARERGGLEQEHGEEMQVSRKGGRASKKGLPRRGGRNHEWVSGRKSSPGRSAVKSLGFTSSLAKSETGKEVGRQRAHLYDDRANRV